MRYTGALKGDDYEKELLEKEFLLSNLIWQMGFEILQFFAFVNKLFTFVRSNIYFII